MIPDLSWYMSSKGYVIFRFYSVNALHPWFSILGLEYHRTRIFPSFPALPSHDEPNQVCLADLRAGRLHVVIKWTRRVGSDGKYTVIWYEDREPSVPHRVTVVCSMEWGHGFVQNTGDSRGSPLPTHEIPDVNWELLEELSVTHTVWLVWKKPES